MLKLEDICAGAMVDGLIPGRAVTLMATIWHGDHDVEVIYEDGDERIDRTLISRADEERLKPGGDREHVGSGVPGIINRDAGRDMVCWWSPFSL